MPRDLTYSTKNYEQLGGDVWVIGGKLRIATGGQIVPDGGTVGVAPTIPVNTAPTNTTPFGFSTLAQAQQVLTWIETVDPILRSLGLMA